MNITKSIEKHAIVRPNDIALITPKEKLNWAEFNQTINKTVSLLGSTDIDTNQIIAISVRDPLVHLFASLALARLGIGHIALPLTNGDSVRAKLTRQLGVSAIIVENFKDELKSIASIILTDTLIKSQSDLTNQMHVCGRDDTFLILQSSGTTGDPKFSALTFKMAFDRFHRYQTYFNTSSKDIFWPASRLDFVGAKQRVFHCLQAGAAICLLSGRQIDRDLIKFIDFCGVTLAWGTPSHLAQILKASEFTLSLPKIRAFEVGSAPVGEALRSEFKHKINPNLCVSYGANEALHVTIASPDTQAKVADSVGQPFIDMMVEVVDIKGNAVPNGKAGNIRISGKGIIRNYLNNQIATVKSFKDGWFYPGDIGKFVNDTLVFLGRNDDMMIFDGMNIYPVEIENALALHPAVEEVAALSLRHRAFQDVPVAAVVLKEPVRIKELHEHCKEILGIKSPRIIKVMPQFPTNAMGKVMKKEIRKLFHKSITHSERQAKQI